MEEPHANYSNEKDLYRYIKSVERDDSKEGRCELDSHADTIVGGNNCVVLDTTGRTVSVSPFSDEYKSLTDIPIATLATVYENPTSGDIHILILHEALYFGDRLSHTLICPNQLRNHGIIVDDIPRQFDEESTHSIYVPDHDLRIQLELEGIISGFKSRQPSMAELEDINSYIELSSDIEWEPNSIQFEVIEDETTAKTKQKTRSRIEMIISEQSKQQRQIAMACSHHQAICDSYKLVEVETIENDSLATIMAVRRGDPTSEISIENISQKWRIGTETAKRTMKVTTQFGVRSLKFPAQRRFATAMPHLRYPRVNGTFYADTMKGSVKSIRSFNYAHIIGNGKGFSKFYPMVKKNETVQSLDDFVQTHGIMEKLISDGDPCMEESKAWKQSIASYKINQRWTEPYSPWQNRAEIDIRETKRAIKRFTKSTNSPRRLWCFCGELVTAIRSHTATDSPLLSGRCPAEYVLGYTPDISRLIQHGWYDPIWYRDNDGLDKIGRWLGPALRHGGGDGCWILPLSCIPIVRSTIWSITLEEIESTHVVNRIQELDTSIHNTIGDQKINDSEVDAELNSIYPDPDEEWFEDEDVPIYQEPDSMQRKEADEYTHDAFDKYINAQVVLSRGGVAQQATILKRNRNEDGAPIGIANSNPILDSREYVAKFEDGAEQIYLANIIAENLYSQIDQEGRQFQLLKEIIDHEASDKAMDQEQSMYRDKGGNLRNKRTTVGWKLLVEWKDGSTSWAHLKDLKESNPVQVAEYAIANKISLEPAFAWWVPHTIRKKDRIINKVKSKYWKRTHKYGVELPKTVQEALRIDELTGTNFWAKAIEKEMSNNRQAFEFSDDDSIPKGYTEITVHGIFDIKMDLTRKFRLVGDGHKTETPEHSIYSSVVSRDSVRIFFLLAALNDLEVLSADIQNAYLSAPAMEKHWTRAGPEFGTELVGRPCKIVRALYGLKSSGKAFHDYLSMHLRQLGFKSSRADPDVWMKPGTKANGFEYWQYVITYVDDICCAMENPSEFMTLLGKRLTLKPGSVKEPDIYLGADVKKYYIEGSEDPEKARWAISSHTYVKRAIAEVEVELGKVGKKLPTKVKTPLSTGYRPELDLSPELDSARQNYYQGLIGILRWMCELGRIDILMPVSLMSRYLASAREGHLDQLFHVFAYLKAHDRSTMVFDDTLPNFGSSTFLSCDWSDYYPDAQEAIPDKIPAQRGNPVTISCFVDADHAGCRETRRSHTGVIIYVNRAPILWFSKRQNTVESSTYGSEMLAVRIAIEMIEGLRYKLRTFGVTVDGPCNVFCDNNGVVLNTTNPDSKLTKKHASINYHRVREAIAAGTIKVAKEDTKSNLADCLTKLLDGNTLRELISHILW